MREFSNLSEDRFKAYYGNLMEQYQWVEFRLEGLYALCCKEGFLKGLSTTEKHNISALLDDLTRVQKESNITVLLDDEFARIREMCKNRNYWVHECFTDANENVILFHSKTGSPDQKSVERLHADLNEARELANMLYERFTSFIANSPN